MRNFNDSRSSGKDPEPANPCGGVSASAQRTSHAKDAAVVIAARAIENHQAWLRALQSDYAICEVTERRALEQIVAGIKPDVLIVDLALPGLHRVHGLRDVHRLSPGTRIIALTEAVIDEEGLLALKSGAQGYCARTLTAAELSKAVNAVRKGEIWASRKLVRALVAELVSLSESRQKRGVEPLPDPRLAQLTERQRLVALMISHGASNKEIGTRLNISERTVKAHLTEAFRNVGVSDRLQLALLLQGRSFAAGDD
jgi:two-component system nitrate/nitrite response regulator NarL